MLTCLSIIHSVNGILLLRFQWCAGNEGEWIYQKFISFVCGWLNLLEIYNCEEGVVKTVWLKNCEESYLKSVARIKKSGDDIEQIKFIHSV